MRPQVIYKQNDFGQLSRNNEVINAANSIILLQFSQHLFINVI
jgi:hypothetical protein